MNVLLACIPCMPDALRGQKKAPDYPRLEQD